MRPAMEVADISRRHGDAFRAAQRGRLLPDQRRVMAAIEACRTATLGGHVEQCDDCGMVRVAYNSCRLQNKAVVYDILLKAAAETIRVISADPQHLGAVTGLAGFWEPTAFARHLEPLR